MAKVLGCVLPANLKQVGKQKQIWSQKFSINSSQKTRIEHFSNTFLSLEIKSKILEITILLYSSKIDKNWVKSTENVNRNS